MLTAPYRLEIQYAGGALNHFETDFPKDAINLTIDETFVPRAEVKLPTAAGFAAWRTTLLQSLRCVPLVLWDESRRKLVSFREMRRSTRAN